MSILKQMHRIGALLASAVALLTAVGCQSDSSSQSANTTESSKSSSNSTASLDVTGEVTITAFKVGKADALVVQTANSVTVVDTGLKGDGKDIEEFLEAQSIDTIDNLIITHYDKDHVGGAARLINRMNVTNIYVPDYTSESDDYQNFMEKVNESGKELNAMAAGSETSWTADDATYQLFAAEQEYYGKDEENDYSLVLYMTHGENTFLFAGDAEEPRQNEIMGYELGEVTFLKFPYHGNYLSTTESFLDMYNPQVTVICCSKDEDANPSTYETLENRGIEAYYTKNGTVTIVSDGKTLTCSQAAS